MTNANWCQLVPNINPHHRTRLPGEMVPIGAAPFREAPVGITGAAPAETVPSESESTTTNRWPLTVAALLGEPWPPLPELPGTVHQCRDAPLTDEELAEITSPTELALCAGISRQAAHQRLQRQAETPGAPSISSAPEP